MDFVKRFFKMKVKCEVNDECKFFMSKNLLQYKNLKDYFVIGSTTLI